MMKKLSLACALVAYVCSGTLVCFAESIADNRGILNGPLTDRNLGHRASGEGNVESLRLAIEDLMQTYGGEYPPGEEFLKPLEHEKVQDPNSEEFKALKCGDAQLITPKMAESKRKLLDYTGGYERVELLPVRGTAVRHPPVEAAQLLARICWKWIWEIEWI